LSLQQQNSTLIKTMLWLPKCYNTVFTLPVGQASHLLLGVSKIKYLHG